jgi:hypothetical protein
MSQSNLAHLADFVTISPVIASSRKYPFGGKVDVIWTKPFRCMVSTAKEGFFKRQSTVVYEIRSSDGISDRHPLIKFLYSPTLSSGERLSQHENIVEILDRLGSENDSLSLEDAVFKVDDFLRAEGVLTTSEWGPVWEN